MPSQVSNLSEWWSKLGAALVEQPELWMEGIQRLQEPVDLTHKLAFDSYGDPMHLWEHWLHLARGDKKGWACLDTTLPLLLNPPSHLTMPPREWLVTPVGPRRAEARSPLHQRLDQLWETYGNNTSTRPAPALPLWIHAVPSSACMSWRPMERWANDIPENKGTTPILSLALRARMPEADIRDLLTKGASWHTPHLGRSPAQFICSSDQWQWFLATGGNPDAPCVNQRSESDQKIPLWQWLIDNTNAEIHDEMVNWARQERSGQQSQKELDAYWSSLSRGYSINDIMTLLRSRPDWATLVNPEGVPSAWVAAHKHAGAWEKLPKKAESCLELRSKDGTSAAAWALLKGAPPSLVMERSAPGPAPNGRGILAQVLLHPSFSDHESLTEKWEGLFKKTLARSSSKEAAAAEWIDLPAHDRPALAGKIADLYWGSQDNSRKFWGAAKIVGKLAELGHVAMTHEWEMDPLWHTLLALAIEQAPNRQNHQPLKDCAAYHWPRAGWVPGVEMSERNQVMLDCLPEVKRHWEALTLRAQLESETSPEAPHKPRLRL